MRTIEGNFVPYPESLGLQRLGVNKEQVTCFASYQEGKLHMGTFHSTHCRQEEVLALLYQQAFDFFRSKYQLYSEILVDRTSSPKFSYRVTEFIGNPKDLAEREWDWLISINDGLYREQSEAKLECLKKLIEIVKENHENSI
jgi:hypothetical protein